MAELRLELIEPLENRMEDFKKDTEKMKQVNAFLADLLDEARTEAELRNAKKNTTPFGLQNGTKRLGHWSNRARSSARTIATRVITAICNCTTSVRSVMIHRN